MMIYPLKVIGFFPFMSNNNNQGLCALSVKENKMKGRLKNVEFLPKLFLYQYKWRKCISTHLEVTGSSVTDWLWCWLFPHHAAKPTNHRPAESSVSTGSSGSSFGSGYSVDSEGSSSTAGETNLFPIPRM